MTFSNAFQFHKFFIEFEWLRRAFILKIKYANRWDEKKI